MTHKEALQKIEQFSDVGDDFLAVCMMKSIATDALKEQSERMCGEEEVLQILVKFGDEIIKSTKNCSVLIPNYRKFIQSLSQEDKPTEEVKPSEEVGKDYDIIGWQPSPRVRFRIYENDICPKTGEHCDDEYCHIGAICNLVTSGVLEHSNSIEEQPEKRVDNLSFESGVLEGREEVIQEMIEWSNIMNIPNEKYTPSVNISHLLRKLNSLKKK